MMVERKNSVGFCWVGLNNGKSLRQVFRGSISELGMGLVALVFGNAAVHMFFFFFEKGGGKVFFF